MSLRAIKKRENQQQNLSQSAFVTKTSNYRKSTAKQTGGQQSKLVSNALSTLCSLHGLHMQRNLLGRLTHSCPAINRNLEHLEHAQRLVRTKSDTDLHILNSRNNNCNNDNAIIANNINGVLSAKSEICLQSISSHNYNNNNNNNNSKSNIQIRNMLSGARSHRDLSQSAYASVGAVGIDYDAAMQMPITAARRRMSECSFNSGSIDYSQRTGTMSASVMTLASSNDANAIIRVPIIGYEVMEERARFTVYKLRVENPQTNSCWLVLRRYTDFVRLNNKLKQQYPQMNLMLPRKKIFGDNFNAVFLDNRVQGLQIFVNSVMAKEELRKCKLVREFFCLDEAPTYSESMEECRAIFEAQEEIIVNLKMQINNKNDVILSLQQQLREEIAEKQQLKEALQNLSQNQSTHCSNSNDSSAASN